jgi:hypothetical protein
MCAYGEARLGAGGEGADLFVAQRPADSQPS